MSDLERLAFARRIDAAACMLALQHELLLALGIPVRGRGRIPYWT